MILRPLVYADKVITIIIWCIFIIFIIARNVLILRLLKLQCIALYYIKVYAYQQRMY